MSGLITRVVAVSMVACLCFLPNTVYGDELPAAILNKVRSATVFIKVTSSQRQGRGSGFFVTPEIVVTNAHVIGVTEEDEELPEKVEVVLNSGAPNEQQMVAEIAAVDVSSDLAFLKVPRQAGVHSLSLRPSAEITETLPVYILGFPLGEGLDRNGRNPSVTISSGHVSSLRRDTDNQIAEIQIDGSLIPGNSGGPIIDSKGELVAVSAAAILGLHIGFSIPGDAVQYNLDGRIDQANYEYEALANGTYSVKAKVTAVDPQKRIRRVALYYWTSPPNTTRPIDPQGKFATYGAPGDGPRKHVELSFDAKENKWVGAVTKIALRPDQDFWIQPAAARVDGVRRVAAVSHAAGLRKTKSEPESANSVASSRSTSQRAVSPARGSPRFSRGRQTTPQARSSSGNVAGNAGVNNNNATAREVARYFNSDKRPAAPKPVAPPASVALDATRERDKAGYPYTLVRTTASTASLGDSKLLQMVADPHGDRVYAILQNQSKILVFDPADMSLKDELVVPREPVSIWCDAERLIVACSQSRVIVFIDTKTLQPVKSARIEDSEEMQPIRVVGRTPDGSAITLWRAPGNTTGVTSLYLVGEKGGALKVLVGDFDWCSLPNANQVWMQDNFGGSPSGVARVVSLTDPKGIDRFNGEPFGRKGFSMHRSCGHCFLSEDAKSFIVPTEARDLVSEAWGYATRTLVSKSDLSKITMELEGSVLYEYSSGDCYVAWKDGRTRDKVKAGPEIMYYSRSSGRMIRRILVEGFDPHPAIFTNTAIVPEAVFVPGQELLLVADRSSTDAKITIIPCGPVIPDADVAADPSMRVENAPPKLAVVGKPLSYTPSFTRPKDAKKIVFRLDQAVSGMTIDPSSGKVSFTPTDANLGLYDIAIVADIDGIEVPVITWLLEIDVP